MVAALIMSRHIGPAVSRVNIEQELPEGGLQRRGRATLRWSDQTARQIHPTIREITSPNISNTADQISAEIQLANWKRQYGISKIPAASGTVARSGPKNRPM